MAKEELLAALVSNGELASILMRKPLPAAAFAGIFAAIVSL